tara:strand:- start:769 stop:4776 length:4008 start_codon:yes stop_codon:yes gene_type:complete
VFNKSIAALKSLSIFLSILFLLLVASYVLVTRITLHFLPEYKQEIVNFLSESTNQSITISSINSRWDGFDPVLQVTGLTIESDDPFYIHNISFYFSFLDSLLALQPKFERILIEQTNLRATQTDDGHWTFLGFNTKDLNTTASATTDNSNGYWNLLALFNGSTLNIKNLNAEIQSEQGKLRTLRLPTLNVNYSNDQLFASGKLLQKSGDKALLNFSLRGQGLLPTETLKGVLYIEARSSEFFDGFLDVYNWQKISIQDIEGSSRAWISFEGKEIKSVYGDLQVSEINWQVDETPLPPLYNLAFSYLWQSSSSNTHLMIDNFAFEWSETQCDAVDVEIILNDLNIKVLADRLNVKCINDLALAVGILPEELHKRLVISEANGYLNNLYLTIFPPSVDTQITVEGDQIIDSLNSTTEHNINKTFTFEAMLEGININAYESTPSGKNLNGYIYADDQSGFVSFLSDDFELGFPALFLEPWEVKRAEGVVAWDLNGGDTSISSDGLRLWRDDNSLIYGDFFLNLRDGDHEDTLSLAIGMQDILFQDAVKFVPYYKVNNDLYSWLSSSLVAGSVKNGVYYGYGSVESISAENSFTSSIYLQSDNGVLQFEPNWPYLEGLNADIFIQNGQLGIYAKEALIAGSKLNDLKAFMPEVVDGTENSINITANSLLNSTAIDYWLFESPIASNAKDVVDQLVIEASAQTDLRLQIPVAEAEGANNKQEIQYTVNTEIINGDILHKPSELKFEDVRGILTVDSKKGINAKGIQTKLFGEQSNLAISTRYHHGKAKSVDSLSQSTMISLQGKLSTLDLFEYFDAVKPTPLDGSFQYQAELSLSNEVKNHPLLTIKTDLMGVSCQCPAPFSKNAHEKEDLHISLLLKPEQSYLDASLKSKHLPSIDAKLMFIQDQPTFGEVLIGGAIVQSTNNKGINVAANLPLANLENWLSFIPTMLDSKSVSETNDTPLLQQVQLEIKNLDGFGYLFQKSKILIKPLDNKWLIDISGNNAKGKVYLPKNDEKLILDFDTLNLVSLDKLLKSTSEKEEKVADSIDPRDIPKLSFNTKKLMLDNRSIGAWEFDVVPDPSGAIIRSIKGKIKGSNIAGQLNWRYTPKLQSTIATFDVTGGDVAALFEAFDFPTLITSSNYRSELVLHWPQAPSEFGLNFLSGKVSLSLEDGFLKTEDQKTGILRLFGVLNAESITRRLKLDFSDLYKSGVGFDSFVAKASIDQGLMTLTEPLVIDGPAGKYVLNGRSDLVNKALDFDMLVELPFSQNVPLAALVLGAPQIGGLVWVADKLLGEPLSALTTSRYDITGTWDQPTVNLKQAMNASKKDRSKEKGKRDVGSQK